jgi:hypothetical protein
MDDELTCGKGLAAHSALPGKLSELLAALAQVLELHMNALDLQEMSGRREHEAYARLVEQHRDLASRLRAVAAEMAGYRDLPIAKHDEAAMAAPEAAAAFARYVQVERELLQFLQRAVADDQQMLEGSS